MNILTGPKILVWNFGFSMRWMEQHFLVVPIFRNLRRISQGRPKIPKWNSGKFPFYSLAHPEFPVKFGRMESDLKRSGIFWKLSSANFCTIRSCSKIFGNFGLIESAPRSRLRLRPPARSGNEIKSACSKNEYRDHPLLFKNSISLNTSREQREFKRKSIVSSIRFDWISLTVSYCLNGKIIKRDLYFNNERLSRRYFKIRQKIRF